MIIKYYETVDGKKPFIIWFETKDASVKTKIITKINFLRNDNFSNCKPVGDGVFERKLFSIRIYFLKYKNTTVLLLLGGEKDKQQQRDIEKAKEYAADYLNRHV
jgi:putative addiction module killer protein